MQNADAGKKASTSRCDEQSIKFRPSPNFKHMKKYLKSKFEEMSGIESNKEIEKVNKSQNEQGEEKYAQVKASSTPPMTATTTTTKTTATTTATTTAVTATPVQPPLPPNPPPPYSPITEIKQEFLDDDYLQYTTVPNNVDMYGHYNPLTQEQQEITPKVPKTEVTMCRNFVRGTCMKGAACKFAHELILSQLSGVYTFCRNFQNRQCTFTKCKFVHATVFEKEYFYRTGYLPPHALAHLQGQQQPPPPPPPPPEETAMQDISQQDISQQDISQQDITQHDITQHDITQHDITQHDITQHDTTQHDLAQQDITQYDISQYDMAQQGYYGTTALDTNLTSMLGMGMEPSSTYPSYMMQYPLATGYDSMFYGPGTSTSTTTYPGLKRDWTETFPTYESNYLEADFSSGEPLPKQCKNCDSNEFRYQYHKNKAENMISDNEDVKKKLAQLNVKTQRLNNVLMTLFKQQTPVAAPGLSTLTSAFQDQDNNMLQQMSLLLGTNTRSSAMMAEENMTNMLGTNVNFQLLAQLLMNAVGHQPPQ